jgi:RND family efflux transporter MFP subunit
MKLSFKTGGIIEAIPVREGQEVARGQELARLDLAEIQAQVTQARIGQEKARRDLDRARNLYEDSVVTLEQYQNARSAYELARAQRQVADFNLRHSTITAPSRGKVQKLLMERNELISPGHPVLLFASTENDWVVRASISDKDIVKLMLGDSAEVFMDPVPGERFPGEIVELGSVADPVSGTYEVEVRLERQHPQFRSGFISRVLLLPSDESRALVLPIQCLVNASDRRADVFVWKEGRVERRRVRIGALLQDQVEVLEGLSEGERVVREGARYLNGGEEVSLNSRKP